MKLQLAVALGLLLATNVAYGQQQATLKSVDADSDGKVTVKEFSDYAGARIRGFDQLDAFAKKVDADGDGIITEEEFGKRREVLRSMAQPQADAKKDTAAHKVGDKASDFELQSIGTVSYTHLTLPTKA